MGSPSQETRPATERETCTSVKTDGGGKGNVETKALTGLHSNRTQAFKRRRGVTVDRI